MKPAFPAALLAMALAATAPAHALSLFDVSFSPNQTAFSKGRMISVAVQAIGVDVEYRYVLERLTAGAVYLPVTVTAWTSNRGFEIDTGAENVLPGKYRLKVMTREAANRPETLVKTEVFSISSTLVSACKFIEGRSFNLDSAAGLTFGTMSLADALSFFTGQLNYPASSLSSLHFQNGTLTADTLPASGSLLLSLIPIPFQISPAGHLSGSYSCSGNTLTIQAGGALEPDNTLMSILDGNIDLSASLTGTFVIDPENGTISSGGLVFE